MAAVTHRFSSETYSESASSVKTCEYWFRRFKSDDFDFKEYQGSTKKYSELQALLDKNSTQTLEELAEALNVTRNMKDSKRRQRFHMNCLN